MSVSLPLDQMTVEEKLRVMEDLWEDLNRNAEDLAPPTWHGDVLQAIEARIQRGEEQSSDWNVVKQRLRSELE